MSTSEIPIHTASRTSRRDGSAREAEAKILKAGLVLRSRSSSLGLACSVGSDSVGLFVASFARHVDHQHGLVDGIVPPWSFTFRLLLCDPATAWAMLF